MPAHVDWKEGVFTGKPYVQFSKDLNQKERSWLQTTLASIMPLSKNENSPKLNFEIDSSVQGDEAYDLEITPSQVDLKASSTRGLYWSLQTLRQLDQDGQIPCVSIQDAPKFGWRGVMLDEGRHFLGEKFVKNFLDVVSMYKFNVMHWHLTDDQGWRIEIKSHPELTNIGAWRIESDGTRTGGYYTQKQIKDIVSYAAARNITIVPEIEMPGHASAAIASDPWLTCTRQQIQVPTTWGVFGTVYCAGRETTYKFLDDVLTEVAGLFPSQYIHIGGDEVPTAEWQACSDCQARMKAESLQNEEQLQGYFTNRIVQMLAAKGKIAIGWDEILKGNASPNAVAQVWNNQSMANEAITSGHDVVLSLQSNCYLNSPPANLTLDKVYAYDPLEGIQNPTKVLGIETTLWSENITTKNCMMMFLPRGLAISEIAWSNPQKDLGEFENRVQSQLAFLDKEGIEYGSPNQNLISYFVAPNSANQTCRLNATFGVNNLNLRYTLDGSAPNKNSPAAESTIEWPVGKTLRVSPFKNDRELQEPTEFDTVKSIATGAKITFETQPLAPYTLAGPQGLTDGLLGTRDFHDNIWLGWEGSDLIADCDLGKEMSIHEIALHCLQEMRSWILMPTTVSYEISDDGQKWKPYGQFQNSVQDRQEGWILQWCVVKRTAAARFIRITARNYGKLPAWHLGAGGQAWVFADEFIVK